MFAYWTLPGVLQGLCWLLTALIAVLLIGGFALSPYDANRGGRMRKITELPQTLLLILIAVIGWIYATQSDLFPTFASLILGGIIFGFIGDLCMANLFKTKHHVLHGMAAFGIGHILYMLAFREIALDLGMTGHPRFAVAIVIVWIAGIVLWMAVVRKPNDITFIQYAALGYMLLLATMAGIALGLALHSAALIPLAIGAILFLISDTLIAVYLFSGRNFPYRADLVWFTYILAQTLIVTIVPTVFALPISV
jgi:hypothetical protein